MAACKLLDSPQQASDARVTLCLATWIETKDGEAVCAIASSVCLIIRAASCTAMSMCCTSPMLAATASCCAVHMRLTTTRPYRSAGSFISALG